MFRLSGALGFVLLAGLGGASGSPRVQEGTSTERLLSLLEERNRRSGDPLDPRAAGAALGFEPGRLLGFVRDELAYEPYSGILRDGPGALLTRSGNSLDRALLLKAMMEAGGYPVRLVRAELDEAEGARLLEACRTKPPRARPAGKEVDPRSLAAELGVDAKALETLVLGWQKRDQAFIEEVLEAARTEMAMLESWMGDLKAAPAPVPRNHYWLQLQNPRTQEWTDLDPSPVPLAKKSPQPVTPDQLASERRSVTFRVVLHRRVGDRLETVPLLTAPFDLSALAWRPVELMLLPAEGQLADGGRHVHGDPKALLEGLGQVKIYRAGLLVDGRPYGAAPFDLNGNVFEVDRGGRVGPARNMGKSVTGAFGGFGGALGGGGGRPEPSRFEKLVLEIEVQEPGRKKELHARTLVGPPPEGERFRAVPILQESFLVSPAILPKGERQRRELSTLAGNVPAMRQFLKGQWEGVHFNPGLEVSGLLLAFDDFRRRLALGLQEGSSLLQDRVGLFAETRQLFVDFQAKEARVRRGIDILSNPTVFVDPAGKTEPKRAALMGVADTALEALLVARVTPGETSYSAWTLLERARLAEGKPEVLATPEGRRLIRWSKKAAWSLDPGTGNSVGRVSSGEGQGMLEYAWEHRDQICGVSDILSLFSAGKMGPDGFRNAADWLGRLCSFSRGSNVPDWVKDKILEMDREAWAAATSALSGGGGE